MYGDGDDDNDVMTAGRGREEGRGVGGQNLGNGMRGRLLGVV